MITDAYHVHVSIPLNNGARAIANFRIEGDADMTPSQAMFVRKLLKSCDGEIYISVVKTTIDSDHKITG